MSTLTAEGWLVDPIDKPGARWSDSTGTALVDPQGRARPVGLTVERIAARGALITDFSTLTGYSANNSGTIALVTTDGSISAAIGKSSNSAIEFTIPAGTQSELSFPAFTAPQVPNSSFAIVVELMSGLSGAGAIANWYLATDGFYTNFYLRTQQLDAYGINVLAPVHNGTVSGWSVTGSPTFSTITRAKFRVSAGAQNVVVRVHGMLAGQYMPPTVALIQDDGDDDGYNELMPLLNKYGFKAGFSIIGSQIGNAGVLTAAQLAQLYADGHDLIAHGEFNLTSLGSAALAYADIQSNWNYLVDRGYTRGRNLYVYPNGAHEYSAADPAGIKAFLWSLGVRAAWLASGQAWHATVPAWGLVLPRYPLNASVNTTTLLNTVDAAIDSGRSVTLMMHAIVASGATGDQVTRANLTTVLDGLFTRQKAGALRVVSPSEQARLAGLI